MAKSLRSKREKRLRAIRRDMVEPLYEKKEAAKQAAMEAALAAPKLPVRTYESNSMEADVSASTPVAAMEGDDVAMEEANQKTGGSLKPMGKKMKKKVKIAKRKGKGKLRRRHV